MMRARLVAMAVGLTIVGARLSYGAEANLALFVANLGEVCANTTAAGAATCREVVESSRKEGVDMGAPKLDAGLKKALVAIGKKLLFGLGGELSAGGGIVLASEPIGAELFDATNPSIPKEIRRAGCIRDLALLPTAKVRSMVEGRAPLADAVVELLKAKE